MWKDNNWKFRNVIVNENKYYMLKLIHPSLLSYFLPFAFYKLIKNNGQNIKNRVDLGGLDLFPQINFKRVKHELKFLSKPIKIYFSNIETIILYDKQHIDELIRVYGEPKTWAKYTDYLTDDEKKQKNININKLLIKFNIK